MDLVDIDKAFSPKTFTKPLFGSTTVSRAPARMGLRTRVTTTHQPGLVGRAMGRKPTTSSELENVWQDYGARVRGYHAGRYA
jgi:hypothetical protein